MLLRRLALVVAVVALVGAVGACGSSSGSSSPGSPSEPSEGAAAASGADEVEEGAETESELEHIMWIQIYGKFGGTRQEFDVGGGSCKIVKINVAPAEVKADPEAILDHEKNASVQVAPQKGATAAECRKAVESAIG